MCVCVCVCVLIVCLLFHLSSDQVVESFYSGKRAEIGPYFEVNFDGEEVSLDIPKDGINLPNGWAIQPLVYPPKVSISGK